MRITGSNSSVHPNTVFKLYAPKAGLPKNDIFSHFSNQSLLPLRILWCVAGGWFQEHLCTEHELHLQPWSPNLNTTGCAPTSLCTHTETCSMVSLLWKPSMSIIGKLTKPRPEKGIAERDFCCCCSRNRLNFTVTHSWYQQAPRVPPPSSACL